jgi:thioredoxin-like negative regulator of GroEL/uncharacterized protein (AIM24 family)
VARLAGGDEVEGLDEEFVFHLNRGADLLARGEAEPASAALERALALRSKDAKVLGLLGQAFYRLGRFDDATIAWQRLVDDNPVEPAARVNLGLAFLKGKHYPEATKQLEIALDLNPDHKKAMGYLGLALLEAGDAKRAREWFRRAGSDQMVARCEELLQGALRAAPPGAEPTVPAAEPVVAAQPEAPPPAPEPIHIPAPARTAAPRPSAPEAGLAAFAAARLVRPPAGELFAVTSGVLAVTVKGEVRVRLDGLVATRGKVQVAPEQKRFRGRPTEKPFGDGARRMHRARGDGLLLYRAGGRRFTALDLGPDAVYLREEVVFGFEEAIAFENGRVTSMTCELDLVHLRGRGRFLLATGGEPVALEVAGDAPLRVPLEALVGWVGALTPRIVPLLDGGPDVAVELAGEGRVLCDPGPAPGGDPA